TDMAQLLPTLLLFAGGVVLLGVIYASYRSFSALFAGEGDSLAGATGASEARLALVLRKEALLADLKDLSFERDAGKLAPEDFERLDAKVRAEAKEVLRALDEELA